MAIDATDPPKNIQEGFSEFFRNFDESNGNKFKYREQISAAYANSRLFLEVCFEDVLAYNPALANFIRTNPEEAISEATGAFKEIYQMDASGLFNPDLPYSVRFFTNMNLNEVGIKEIRTYHKDQLIYVKGIIVRASEIIQQCTIGFFQCQTCATVMAVEQDGIKMNKPRQCQNSACKAKKDFQIISEDSQFIDYQTIVLQESPEDLRSGEIPGMLQCVLLKDLVDAVRPGERVWVMGILKNHPKEDRRGRLTNLFKKYLQVNNIRSINQEEDQDLTPVDIEEIEQLSQESNIQEKIAGSIARGILGRDNLKLATALSLFGGNEKIKKDGSRLRGNIHVLFMGDPGTGKSQILQNAALISPRSIYTSGQGSSAAGLTAAVIKEKNNSGMQLEAGALVLASGGVALIDEFDKMRKRDRSAIHEMMEQQTISISKAGINATLQAKTAIIAAANPKQGRWNDYETPISNINLSSPILSRFDLIFVVRDVPDKNTDDRIADHILKNHMEGNAAIQDTEESEPDKKTLDYIPIDLLKRYVKYARHNCRPIMTPDAAKEIKAFYIKMRNANPDNPTAVSIVARNLDGMVRLCEAYAKMALRDHVLQEDAKAIVKLQELSLKDIGYDEETGNIDMDIMLTGQSANTRTKLTTIFEKIKELQLEDPGVPLVFEDIYEPLAASHGFAEDFVKNALVNWQQNGDLYCPKPGEYRIPGLRKK